MEEIRIDMLPLWAAFPPNSSSDCNHKNAIKHDFKSKDPTTRWSDVIKLK